VTVAPHLLTTVFGPPQAFLKTTALDVRQRPGRVNAAQVAGKSPSKG
jgi:hypothetical protein